MQKNIKQHGRVTSSALGWRMYSRVLAGRAPRSETREGSRILTRERLASSKKMFGFIGNVKSLRDYFWAQSVWGLHCRKSPEGQSVFRWRIQRVKEREIPVIKTR